MQAFTLSPLKEYRVKSERRETVKEWKLERGRGGDQLSVLTEWKCGKERIRPFFSSLFSEQAISILITQVPPLRGYYCQLKLLPKKKKKKEKLHWKSKQEYELVKKNHCTFWTCDDVSQMIGKSLNLMEIQIVWFPIQINANSQKTVNVTKHLVFLNIAYGFRSMDYKHIHFFFI